LNLVRALGDAVAAFGATLELFSELGLDITLASLSRVSSGPSVSKPSSVGVKNNVAIPPLADTVFANDPRRYNALMMEILLPVVSRRRWRQETLLPHYHQTVTQI
jgi:hypothetical protein